MRTSRIRFLAAKNERGMAMIVPAVVARRARKTVSMIPFKVCLAFSDQRGDRTNSPLSLSTYFGLKIAPDAADG